MFRLYHDTPRKDRAATATDRLLLPFLTAPTDAAAERALQHLMRQHAEPVIDGIVRRYWGPANRRAETDEEAMVDNARSDALYETVRRLRRARAGLDTSTISNFPAYVAVTTYHICDHGLRRLRPERHRLKLHICTFLLDARGLALWESNGVRLCGFSKWRDEMRRPNPRRVRHLSDNLHEMAWERGPEGTEGAECAGLAEAVTKALNAAGCPVPLEDLVNIVSQVLDVREAGVSSLTVDADCESGEQDLVDTGPGVECYVELRDFLQRLWREIRELPLRQRTALLLNLRGADGRDGVELLPLSRIADQDEIACALEITRDELDRLWEALPMDDQSIAVLLGCTRQQVIGLRDTAKRRLQRRMQEQDRTPGTPFMNTGVRSRNPPPAERTR
jgi:hypothetical protein